MTDTGRAGRIEVRVAETAQLFDAMDPSPPEEKDLSPAVHEFIVGSARELQSPAGYDLRVYITRAIEQQTDVPVIVRAIGHHFAIQAEMSRRHLRRLFQLGRRVLLIGVVFLAAALTAGELIREMAGASHAVRLIGESLTIGGWVAMWRPLEIFLYDWWPVRNDIRLYRALADAPVEIRCGESALA